MKRCAKCRGEFEVSAFNKDRSRSDGLFPWCRTCALAHKKVDYLKHKPKQLAGSKRWAEANREKSNGFKRKYEANNKEKARQSRAKWAEENKEMIRQRSRDNYAANREDILARIREYNAAHPEKKQARQKRYEDSHWDQILQRSRDYYATHKELHNARAKSWSDRHPEAKLAHVHNRRAKKLANGGTYTESEWIALKRKYDYRCLCCFKQEPEIWLTIDHVVPIAAGGRNSIDNLQPLCLHCNQSKGTKCIDFRESSESEVA